jgi:hypothetical protein
MNAYWHDDHARIEEKSRYARDLLDRHADTTDLDHFNEELEEPGSKFEIDELS